MSGLGHLLTSCSGVYTWRFTQAKCTCWCHVTAAMARRDAQAAALAAPMLVAPAGDTSGFLATLGATLATSRPVVSAPEHEVQIIPPDPVKVLVNLCNTGLVSPQLVNMVAAKLGATYPVEEKSPVVEIRRKRGELEDNVETVCRMWLMKLLPWEDLTTDAIALMIDANDRPSQGAIYAVLKRWAEHNWATIAMGPFRFVSFSDEVLHQGMTEVRRLAKREADRRAKGFF